MRRDATCWVLLGALSMGVVIPALSQSIQVNQNNRTIAVTATDKAVANPDVAIVTVGYLVYGPDSDSTYRAGSERSNAILGSLANAGIPDNEIESQAQSLTHTEFPENDKSTPEERQQRQFTLSQSWTVKSPAKDAAKVLHLAIEAGANESGHIDWELSDHAGLQAQAAAKALVHAREIATRMASGMNARLGALVYASNQAPIQRFAGMTLNTESASISSVVVQAQPLVIKPKEVEESASVYAVFAIE